MAEMVATEIRTFVLEQALTVIGTPQLDLKVDTYTRFTAEQAVPEGVAPIPKRAAVSRTSYDLTKDVSLIGITDEAQLRTVHDLHRLYELYTQIHNGSITTEKLDEALANIHAERILIENKMRELGL